MSGNHKTVQHSMQGVFVFVLLGLFAVMSTLMVLLGAQMYRNTVDHAEANNEGRLLGAYVRSMIRMGVAAGREDQVMGKIADLYEEQVEDGISRLVAIIEPTLIALLAVVIGAVLLSVMLPMAGILSSML